MAPLTFAEICGRNTSQTQDTVEKKHTTIRYVHVRGTGMGSIGLVKGPAPSASIAKGPVRSAGTGRRPKQFARTEAPQRRAAARHAILSRKMAEMMLDGAPASNEPLSAEEQEQKRLRDQQRERREKIEIDLVGSGWFDVECLDLPEAERAEAFSGWYESKKDEDRDVDMKEDVDVVMGGEY